MSKPLSEQQQIRCSLFVKPEHLSDYPSSISLLRVHGFVEETRVHAADVAVRSIDRSLLLLLDLRLLGRGLGGDFDLVLVVVIVVGSLLCRVEIRLVKWSQSRQGMKHTVALLGGSRGRLSGLRSLRGFRSRCGGVAAELGGELLSTVLHGAELVLESGGGAVSVKRRHELVGFRAQGGALGVHDRENAGHGFEAEGLRLGLVFWRHGARGVLGWVM
jgi:hypothetical protein